MMTDHEAIEYFEAIFETAALGKTDIEAMNIAISALREREERSKGCKQCEGLVEINLYRYCPMCGRRLKG